MMALPLVAAVGYAHPMGNLSVNHYAKLTPSGTGVEITFALDLAEIPTFELLQAGELTEDAPWEVLERRAAAEAKRWVSELRITEGGKALAPRIEVTELVVVEGAGNLPVFRVTTRLHVAAKGGRVEFEDRNYAARAGWREIVVVASEGAEVLRSSKGAVDLSHGLTAYPLDPQVAPRQDQAAWFEWKRAGHPVEVRGVPVRGSGATEVLLPSGARPAEVAAAGTIQRNDAISKLLRRDHMSWGAMGLLLALAFWFGALHALEPGHGKTMVAAYLVGARGTPKHAFVLGGMVTFTHTVSVFALGLATMFLSQYVLPEKLAKVLGIVSGGAIIWIGGVMLWRRVRKLGDAHAQERGHAHSHGRLTHTHGQEGEVSMGGLLALGASGGLVPCPSALILLLSAISMGKVALGMLLLVTFSLGLALVLTATGMLVLYARNLFPGRRGPSGMLVRYMPVVSAAAIVVIGIVMTRYSLG